MSKRKKTRQQKIIADLKRKVATEQTSASVAPTVQTSTFSLPKATVFKQPVNTPSATTYSPTYLKNDIIKTGTLTLFIIAAQLVLFFLLKQHTIKIPGLGY